MKFMDSITLPDAAIKELKTKPWEKKNKLEFHGRLTPETALTLGLSTFRDDGLIREGWTYMEEKSAGCAAARLLIEIEGLRSLELTVDEITDVYATRAGQDFITVGMKAQFSGSVLDLVAWLEECGKKIGVCRVTPLQQELVAAAESEATIVVRNKATGAMESIPIPQDTLRHAVLGRRKKVTTIQ